MRLIRQFLLKQILGACALVCAAFLLLFAFFDLVGEMSALTPVYGMAQAAAYVAALAPSHLYDLLPIGVLIACVWVLSRLAIQSEFTVMRTSGLGPGRVLATLLGIGLVFSLLTLGLGDYIAPNSNRLADWIKHQQNTSGAWLRDQQPSGQYFIHVQSLRAVDDSVQGVHIMRFDAQGRLSARIEAEHGRITPAGWLLQAAHISTYPHAGESANGTPIVQEQAAQYLWPTQLSTEMVSTAMVSPESMATLDLYRYSRHLEHNKQNARLYDIALWRKLLYPFSCLVMVMLALPFAYLHHRNTGITAYIFMGVMLGISFYLFNNVSNHIGNLRGWEPWLAAALPSMVYGLAAMGLFTWLVLRR